MTETKNGPAGPDQPSGRRAILWSGFFVALSLAVSLVFWRWRGAAAAQQYLAGYLIELGLSVDNVFIFILIFSRFEVPRPLQRKVLSWGIWSAIILRGAFLLAGLGVMRRFHAILYVFGAFLVFAGIKLLLTRNRPEADPARGAAAGFIRRHLPVSDRFHGRRFFAVENGRRVATLLFVVLLVVETTDLIFAVDSLPAVLAVTQSAAVAIASNFFAILGLRSLYFALDGAMPLFKHLKTGLATVLVFIGAKMLAQPWLEISPATTLGVIAVILTTSALVGRSQK